MSLIYGIVTTQRFAHAVSKGDTPQIREHVNQIFSSLDKRSMDHQTLMLAIQEIYGTTVNMLESRVFAVDPSLRELNIDASMSEEAIQEKFLSNILAISQNNIQERARSQRVRLIKRYIIDHFEEDISLQHLADEFNMNPNYLSEIFKEETGQNFRSFLVEIRIERAIELMKDRRYQIQQIAEMVGYPDCTYFNKAFKLSLIHISGSVRRDLLLRSAYFPPLGRPALGQLPSEGIECCRRILRSASGRLPRRPVRCAGSCERFCSDLCQARSAESEAPHEFRRVRLLRREPLRAQAL